MTPHHITLADGRRLAIHDDAVAIVSLLAESWLRKSEQRDKWSFGLTASRMRAAQEKQ